MGLFTLTSTACVVDATNAADEPLGEASEALWTPGAVANGTVAFAGAGPSGAQIVGVEQAVAGGTAVTAFVRSGAGPWTATQPLPLGAKPASIAIDALGDAMTIWSTGSAVQAAYLPAGGAAWTVATLAATTVKPLALVDVDGRNVFTAAWIEAPAGTTECLLRSAMWWSAVSGWGAPATVSPAGECAVSAALGSNAAGSALAAWTGPSSAGIYTSTLPQIRAALRGPAGSWAPSAVIEPSERVANTYYGGLAGVGLTSAGEANVVWYASNKAKASRRAPGQSPWVKQTIATYGFGRIQSASLAMDAAGDAAAVFEYWNFNAQSNNLKTMSRPAGGAWGGAASVASSVWGLQRARVVMSATGTAMLAWQQYDPQLLDYTLRTATQPVGGAWSAIDVAGRTTTGAYGVAASGGQAFLGWSDPFGAAQAAVSPLP